MSFHCIVWYCMVLYCIRFFCTVSHCHVPLLQGAGELPHSASSHFIFVQLDWMGPPPPSPPFGQAGRICFLRIPSAAFRCMHNAHGTAGADMYNSPWLRMKYEGSVFKRQFLFWMVGPVCPSLSSGCAVVVFLWWNNSRLSVSGQPRYSQRPVCPRTAVLHCHTLSHTNHCLLILFITIHCSCYRYTQSYTVGLFLLKTHFVIPFLCSRKTLTIPLKCETIRVELCLSSRHN